MRRFQHFPPIFPQTVENAVGFLQGKSGIPLFNMVFHSICGEIDGKQT